MAMKKNILPLPIALFLMNTAILGQISSNKEIQFYKGGTDSLEKHIYKNIRPKIESISTDYMLFFNLSISSKGIQNIKELYTNESEISKKLREALKETERNWIVSGVKIKQFVIPIILITEKTSFQIKPLSYLDYQKNRQPINCIFIPPIVINYYAPSH
ncbi:MAG: hypothetical protein B7Y11_04760 [Sphingobacteriia bacterium 24-36-13]|nr:MAG: hypothetical protein B7Y11_04760 [Sphingobacteriia bacterium 24-36-13]